MKERDIIRIFEDSAEIEKAWQKEGHQFFICVHEYGYKTIGVLCLKKNEKSSDLIDEIREEIESSLELISLELISIEVTTNGERYLAWAEDITDCEEEVEGLKKELEKNIMKFDEIMEGRK